MAIARLASPDMPITAPAPPGGVRAVFAESDSSPADLRFMPSRRARSLALARDGDRHSHGWDQRFESVSAYQIAPSTPPGRSSGRFVLVLAARRTTQDFQQANRLVKRGRGDGVRERGLCFAPAVVGEAQRFFSLRGEGDEAGLGA